MAPAIRVKTFPVFETVRSLASSQLLERQPFDSSGSDCNSALFDLDCRCCSRFGENRCD
jgi:hypothetical protein